MRGEQFKLTKSKAMHGLTWTPLFGLDDGEIGIRSRWIEVDEGTPPHPTILGFGIEKDAFLNEDGSVIYFPHWALVLFFAVIAILPWFRWRFSLRTLLIATTLVAVVLGLAVYLVRK